MKKMVFSKNIFYSTLYVATSSNSGLMRSARHWEKGAGRRCSRRIGLVSQLLNVGQECQITVPYDGIPIPAELFSYGSSEEDPASTQINFHQL